MSSPPYQANKTGVTSLLKQKNTSDREQDDGALIGGLVGGLLLLSLILTIIAFIIRRHKSAKPPTTSLPVRKTTATSVSQSDLPSAPTTTSVVATTSSLRTATIATTLRSSVDGVNSPPPHLYIDLDTSPQDHRPVPDEWSPVTVIRVSPSLSTLESDGNNKDCAGKRIAGNNLDVIGDNRNRTHQGHVRSLGNGQGSVGDGAGDKARGQSQVLFNFLGVKGKSSPTAASDGRVERSTIHESGSPRKTGDGDEADHRDDPGRRYALPHNRQKHSSLVNYVNLDVTDVGADSDFRTCENYLGSGSSIEKLSLSPESGTTNSFTGQRSRSSSLNTDPTTLTQISLVQRGSIFRTETSGALDRNIELPGGVSFNDCCISLRPEHSKDHPANETVEMLTQSKVPPLYRGISEKANLGQKTPGTQHLNIPSQQHFNTRNKEMSSSLSQLSTKNVSTGILQQLNKMCKRYKARSDSSYAYRHNRKDSAETNNTATGYLESGTPPLQTDVHGSPRKAGDLFATQEAKACQPHPTTPALPSSIKFSENSQSRPTCDDKDVHPTKEKQTHGAESNPGTDVTPGPEAETVDQALAVSEEIPKDHLPPHDLATLRRHYSLPFSLFPSKRKSVSQTSSFPLAMLRFDDGYLADWDFHDQNQMSKNSKDRRIGICHFTPPGNVYEKAVTKSATKPSATESLVFSTCSTFADNRRWAMDGEAVKKANVLSQSTKDTFKYPTSAHAKGLESYENCPDEKVANITDEMATQSSDSRSLDVAEDCRSKMTAEAHDGRDKKTSTRNQRPTGDISHLTQSPNHDLLEKEVHKESPEALMSSVRSGKTSVNERYLATGLGGCNQAVASPELHAGTLSPASAEADHKSHINGSSNESLDTVHRRGFPLENVCAMNDYLTSGPATTTLIDLDETTGMKSFRNTTKTDSHHRNVFGADTDNNSVTKTSASGHDKGGQDSQNSKMKSRSKTEECDSAKEEMKNTHKVEKTEISFHSFKKHCPTSSLSRLVHSSSPIQNSPHSPDLNVWKKNLNIDYPLSPLVLPLSRIMSTHQSSASMLTPKVISRRPALFTSMELWEEPNNYLRQQSVFSRHMNSLNTSQCGFNNRSRARLKVPTGIHKL